MQPRLAPGGHSVGTMQVMSLDTQCQKMTTQQQDEGTQDPSPLSLVLKRTHLKTMDEFRDTSSH